MESSRHLQRPNSDSIGNRRQYNCHSCSQQYENVRHLQKHARVTGHKTDDLSQNCYICNKRCENFDDLMKHRKMSHPHDINACRFYADTGYCKFGIQCYYRHTESTGGSQSQSQSQDFPKTQEHPPPDPPMMDLIVMLKEMMQTYMQVKEGQGKARPLGS